MRAGPESCAKSAVFFITEFGRGGAETQILRVGAGLVARGWRVGVVSLMPFEGYVDEARAAGIWLETLEMERGRGDLAALARATRILRRERPGVVVGFLFHGVAMAGVAGALARVPRRIASIRDQHFGGPARLRSVGWMLRLGLHHTLVANSELVAAQLSRAGIVPDDRLVVVRNGLDLQPRIEEEERAVLRASAFGAGRDDVQLVAVGNFQAPKDHPNLLRAFATAVRADPRLRLAVVGKGTLPAAASAVLADPRVSARVTLLGQRTDVRRLLGAADVVVLASSSEGLPNVLMEALSVGTPVVSTRVGGVEEIVREGESGLLVPPRDSRALADAMLLVGRLSDEDRRRMGERGRAYVVDRYDLAAVVGAWEALFEGAGAGTRSGAFADARAVASSKSRAST